MVWSQRVGQIFSGFLFCYNVRPENCQSAHERQDLLDLFQIKVRVLAGVFVASRIEKGKGLMQEPESDYAAASKLFGNMHQCSFKFSSERQPVAWSKDVVKS